MENAPVDGKQGLSRESRWVLILISSMAAAHIIAAMSFPLLSSEAYYWLWGQFPALGYFDHPPMVGWLSWLFFGWVKGSVLTARSPSIILCAATTWVVYLLGCELFGSRRTGWQSALLFSMVPIFAMGGVMLQPDTGLMLFTALTWLFFWRAANRGESLIMWALTGVCAGLALLSKFHAWALLPPLLFFLVLSPPHRRLLKTPSPWLAIALALAVLSPNLFWNSRHDWLTYFYQSRRSGLGHAGLRPLDLFTYLTGPLLTISPLVYLAMIMATWRSLRDKDLRQDPAILYLLLAGAPLPLFFLLLSPFVSISLHWPALSYVPLVILTVGLVDRSVILSPKYWRSAKICSACMLVVLLVSPWVARISPGGLALPFHAKEANLQRLQKELTDWPRMGNELRDLYEQRKHEGFAFIMTHDYHLAAQLSFYAALTDRFQIMEESREHQYDLWEKDQPDWTGASAIVVVPANLNLFGPGRPNKKSRSVIRHLDSLFQSWSAGPGLGGEQLARDANTAKPRKYKYQVIYANGYKGESASRKSTLAQNPQSVISRN